MLVLTVRRGREILLTIPGERPGEDREVVITLLAADRREVSIGIAAPEEITIERVKRTHPEEEPA
jgi:sRNA-binding carbon storage regulator CsrA